jgi:hypothetical protein
VAINDLFLGVSATEAWRVHCSHLVTPTTLQALCSLLLPACFPLTRDEKCSVSLLLSRVYGSVTNYNGVWIGWLVLLTPSFAINYYNHNNWAPKIRSNLAGIRLSSLHRLIFNWHLTYFFQRYLTTDGHSASLSWNRTPIWGLRPDFYYYQTVMGLLVWGTLSDDRTGLSFTIVAGFRRRSHSWVQVPWDSWPYFTVSDSRLLFSSPPTTRRATVEVFDTASTRGWFGCYLNGGLYSVAASYPRTSLLIPQQRAGFQEYTSFILVS